MDLSGGCLLYENSEKEELELFHAIDSSITKNGKPNSAKGGQKKILQALHEVDV